MALRATRPAGAGILTLALAVTAASCTGSDDPGTPSSPPNGASAFQLRPVEHVLSPRDKGWNTTELTCPDEWERCLAAVGAEPVVVRGLLREKYLLGPVIVDGTDVVAATAHAGNASTTGWSVDVQLSEEGSNALASATTAAVGSRIGMVIEGHVLSAPTVNAPIKSGAVVIAGGLSEAAAKRIAASLETSG